MVDNNTILGLVGAVIAAIPGILALIWGLAKNRAETQKVSSESGKAQAEASQIMINTALTLIDTLHKQIDELSNTVIVLRSELERQIAITNELECQIKELKSVTSSLVERHNQALEKLKYFEEKGE